MTPDQGEATIGDATPKALRALQVDASKLMGHVHEVVRSSVEETLTRFAPASFAVSGSSATSTLTITTVSMSSSNKISAGSRRALTLGPEHAHTMAVANTGTASTARPFARRPPSLLSGGIRRGSDGPVAVR